MVPRRLLRVLSLPSWAVRPPAGTGPAWDAAPRLPRECSVASNTRQRARPSRHRKQQNKFFNQFLLKTMVQDAGRHRPPQGLRHVRLHFRRCKVQRVQWRWERLRPWWRHRGCSRTQTDSRREVREGTRKKRGRAKELVLYRHCRTGYPPAVVLGRRGVGHNKEAVADVPKTRVHCMSLSTAAKSLTVACAPGRETAGVAITAWAANAVDTVR